MEEGFKTKTKMDFYNPNYTHVSPNTKNPVDYKERHLDEKTVNVIHRKL